MKTLLQEIHDGLKAILGDDLKTGTIREDVAAHVYVYCTADDNLDIVRSALSIARIFGTAVDKGIVTEDQVTSVERWIMEKRETAA